jgi:hypothetical protein
LAVIADLFVDPLAGFRALAARPRWLVPFVGLIVLNAGFTAIWLSHADPVEMTRQQFEEAGVFERIPPERHEEVVQAQARRFPIFAWLGPFVFAPIVFTVIAGLYLFVFRFFYESEMTFGQAMAVVFWSFFVVSLVLTPVTLAVLYLKNDWNLDPRTVVKANVAGLLDKSSVSKPIYALLDAVDLFSAWTLFLLSAGFGVMSKKSTGSAAVGVLMLFAVYVFLKMGMALIF